MARTAGRHRRRRGGGNELGVAHVVAAARGGLSGSTAGRPGAITRAARGGGHARLGQEREAGRRVGGVLLDEHELARRAASAADGEFRAARQVAWWLGGATGVAVRRPQHAGAADGVARPAQRAERRDGAPASARVGTGSKARPGAVLAGV